jgi:hypothetical protein
MCWLIQELDMPRKANQAPQDEFRSRQERFMDESSSGYEDRNTTFARLSDLIGDISQASFGLSDTVQMFQDSDEILLKMSEKSLPSGAISPHAGHNSSLRIVHR